MQRFLRNKVPPSIFREEQFRKSREQLLDFFSLDTQERSQTRVPMEDLELNLNQVSPVYDALGQMFRWKCAFCESKDHPLPYRFRPTSSATSTMGGIDSHLYYVWLANAWENIYPICLKCIPRQPSFFPVKGKRAPIPNLEQLRQYADDNLGSWRFSTYRETAVLLDPCVDQRFEKHFFPSVNGELLPLSEEGDITIANFRLDRPELNELREAKLRQYREELLASGEHLPRLRQATFQTYFDFAELEFGGLWYLQCRRIALYLSQRAGLTMPTGRSGVAKTLKTLLSVGDYQRTREQLQGWIKETDFGRKTLNIPPTDYGVLGTEPDQQKTPVPLVYPSLHSIELQHFKAIEHLELNLGTLSAESQLSNETLQPALLILGENATGKSSILEAIALALSHPDTPATLNLTPASFVLSPAQLGSDDVASKTPAQVRLSFDEGQAKVLRIDDNVFRPDGPDDVPPVFAYGAFRQYQKRSPPAHEADHAIINLFETDRLLANPEHWLLGLEGEDFNDVARALKIIMSVDGDIKVIEKAPDGKSCLIVTVPAGVVTRTPLNDVSSGYRTILAMVCDIMQRLMDRRVHPRFQGLEHAQAVVLIDEVEAHLHPRWKIQIMHVLRKALPKVTFIATSHDPLCLRGMQKGEVVVVQRRSKAGGAKTQYATCIEQLSDLPDSSRLTIEQLLTSDFFNLMSTDQPEMEKQLASVADLLSKRKNREVLTAQEQRVMAYFEDEVNDALPVGTSEAQRVVQEAVAEFLQRRKKEPSSEWETIRVETKTKILNILKDF